MDSTPVSLCVLWLTNMETELGVWEGCGGGACEVERGEGREAGREGLLQQRGSRLCLQRGSQTTGLGEPPQRLRAAPGSPGMAVPKLAWHWKEQTLVQLSCGWRLTRETRPGRSAWGVLSLRRLHLEAFPGPMGELAP